MMETTMTPTIALRPARTSRPRLSVRGVLDFFAEADARHRARVQLSHLDDHLLRDMGLTRNDIEAAIRRD